MDTLALAFHTVLCSRGSIIPTKPKRNGSRAEKNPDWCYILRIELLIKIAEKSSELKLFLSSHFNKCISGIKCIVFVQFSDYLITKLGSVR